MITVELKPCPFCGGISVLRGGDDVGGHPFWYVDCKECGAMTRGADTFREAAEIWNNRKEGDHDRIHE